MSTPDFALWLSRFTDAQAPVYNEVLTTLASGHKHGCYMWFVFPQILGLGTSPESEAYGIPNAQAANVYLTHPVLGPRLRECTALVIGHTPQAVFNYALDRDKFWACMTLFHRATKYPLFRSALDLGFSGRLHEDTEHLLNVQGRE